MYYIAIVLNVLYSYIRQYRRTDRTYGGNVARRAIRASHGKMLKLLGIFYIAARSLISVTFGTVLLFLNLRAR